MILLESFAQALECLRIRIDSHHSPARANDLLENCGEHPIAAAKVGPDASWFWDAMWKERARFLKAVRVK